MNYTLFKINKHIGGVLSDFIFFITKPIRIYTKTKHYRDKQTHKYLVKNTKRCIKDIYKHFYHYKKWDTLYVTSIYDLKDSLFFGMWDSNYFLKDDFCKKLFMKKLNNNIFSAVSIDLETYEQDFLSNYRGDFSDDDEVDFMNVKHEFDSKDIIIKINKRRK